MSRRSARLQEHGYYDDSKASDVTNYRETASPPKRGSSPPKRGRPKKAPTSSVTNSSASSASSYEAPAPAEQHTSRIIRGMLDRASDLNSQCTDLKDVLKDGISASLYLGSRQPLKTEMNENSIYDSGRTSVEDHYRSSPLAKSREDTSEHGYSFGTYDTGLSYGTSGPTGLSYGTSGPGQGYGTSDPGHGYGTSDPGFSYGNFDTGHSYGGSDSGTSRDTSNILRRIISSLVAAVRTRVVMLISFLSYLADLAISSFKAANGPLKQETDPSGLYPSSEGYFQKRFSEGDGIDSGSRHLSQTGSVFSSLRIWICSVLRRVKLLWDLAIASFNAGAAGLDRPLTQEMMSHTSLDSSGNPLNCLGCNRSDSHYQYHTLTSSYGTRSPGHSRTGSPQVQSVAAAVQTRVKLLPLLLVVVVLSICILFSLTHSKQTQVSLIGSNTRPQIPTVDPQVVSAVVQKRMQGLLQEEEAVLVSRIVTEALETENRKLSDIWMRAPPPATHPDPSMFQSQLKTLVIHLYHPVRITHVTLSRSNCYSAPKDFEVYGMMEDREELAVLLGKFLYNQDGASTQTFKLHNPSNLVYPFVKLHILSSWGHTEYTCLYHFRVHGKIGGGAM